MIGSFLRGAVVGVVSLFPCKLESASRLMHVGDNSLFVAQGEMLVILKAKGETIDELTRDVLEKFSKDLRLSAEDLDRILMEAAANPHEAKSWEKKIMIASDRREQLTKLAALLADFGVSESQRKLDVKNHVISIMVGAYDEQIQKLVGYSASVFNRTYKNEDFFHDVARRSIYLLTEQFRLLKRHKEKCTELYLAKLLAWLGIARAIVDKTNKDFGKCIDCSGGRDALWEPWGNSIPVAYRIFMLMQFRGLSKEDSLKVRSEQVWHEGAGDLRFFDSLKKAILSDDKELGKDVLKFIYDFSTASVFRRGQSAVMEWICAALALAHGCRFELIYGAEQCLRNVENDVQTIREIKQHLSISEGDDGRNFLLKLFTHLDVIALDIYGTSNNDPEFEPHRPDDEDPFFKRFKEIASPLIAFPKVEQTEVLPA